MSLNILITGAAGFLGSNYCKHLVKNNIVYAIDIDYLKLKNLRKILGDKLKIIRVDITKKKDLDKLFFFFKKKNIYINTIINNAAINSVPGDKTNKIDMCKEFSVSLIGSDNLINIFIKNKILRKELKRIINIGSDLSVIAPDQRIYKSVFKDFIKPSSYSIIKHGMVGLTKYYASLLAGKGITVNMISPGSIFNDHKIQFVKNLERLIPIGRMGSPCDIFPAIDFLIDSRTNYLTGQNILIDGGRSII